MNITTISNQVTKEPVSFDISKLSHEEAIKLLQAAFNNQSPKQSMVSVDPSPIPIANQKAIRKQISSEVIIQPTQTTPQKQKSVFIRKTVYQNVSTVENGFYHENPHILAKNMFFENFNYVPHDIYKTNEFYEKILTQTKSVTIKHFSDKTHINYCTARIHKIIHPSQ